MTRDRGGGRRRHHAHLDRGDLIRIERGPVEAIAPTEAEWRPAGTKPAIPLTVDSLVRDLRDDPEFLAWLDEERFVRLPQPRVDAVGLTASGLDPVSVDRVGPGTSQSAASGPRVEAAG